MKISSECIPCILKQSLYTAKISQIEDETIHLKILEKIFNEILLKKDIYTAPEFSGIIQQTVRHFSKLKDPFEKIKKQNLEKALKFIPYLEMYIDGSNYKLQDAMRAAILGNIIDLGANPDFNLNDEINKLSSDNILLNDFNSFREDLLKAEYILYIGDNLEEALFDKLLIKLMLPKKVIFATREIPVLNDITVESAKAIGMNNIAEVISSGSRIPGTDLKSANKYFLKLFNSAPLVISKGQGNFETLMNEKRKIYFMFKVKCGAISKRTGYPIGKSILLQSPKGN